MKIKYEEIKSLDLFKGAKEDTLEKFQYNCEKVKINKGKILFLEREDVKNIYIVLRGKVTMYRTTSEGQKRIIYVLTDGTIINEVIFDGITASICCEAFENTEIISISRVELLKIMENDFEFTKAIINSMSKKIRRLYRQLKNTTVIRVDKKVAAKLWKLSLDYGKEHEEGVAIDLRMTITYLAEMLGHPRETISRAMKVLESEGLVKNVDKKIVVDRDKLLEYYRNS